MRVRSSGFVSAGLLCLALITMIGIPVQAADKSDQIRTDNMSIQSAPIISQPKPVRMALATNRGLAPVEVKEPRNISLDFHNADITDVLKALSMQSGANIVTGTDVKGQVTVSLNKVSLSEALDMITALSSYKYAAVGSDTYVVGSIAGVNGVTGEVGDMVVSAAIPVSYTSVDQLGKTIENRFPGLKYTPPPPDSDKQPGPKVLLVTGPKSLIDEARTLVAQVEDTLHDQQKGQVVQVYTFKYISAKDATTMLQTVLPRLNVTVGPTGSINDRPPAGVTFMQTTGGAAAGAAEQREEPKTIILSGYPEDVDKAVGILKSLDTKPSQVLIEAKVTDITVGAQKRLGLTWSWTNFTFDEGTKTSGAGNGNFLRLPITIDAQLDAMLKDNSASMLANPTIAALEGKPATIFIGDEVKYIIRIEETLTGKSFSTETANVGVTLRVVARPDSDGYITLALHPEVSTISEWLTIGTGKGGSTVETTIALPQIARRFTDHVVRVKDGETIVIGGLIRDNEINNLTKVPLLGDLPFFGGLFRHRQKQKEHSEIAIFLKASVMKDM